MATARTVQDVSPHEFVKAYSAHLKRSGKVNQSTLNFLLILNFHFFHFDFLFELCLNRFALIYKLGSCYFIYL